MTRYISTMCSYTSVLAHRQTSSTDHAKYMINTRSRVSRILTFLNYINKSHIENVILLLLRCIIFEYYRSIILTDFYHTKLYLNYLVSININLLFEHNPDYEFHCEIIMDFTHFFYFVSNIFRLCMSCFLTFVMSSFEVTF